MIRRPDDVIASSAPLFEPFADLLRERVQRCALGTIGSPEEGDDFLAEVRDVQD